MNWASILWAVILYVWSMWRIYVFWIIHTHDFFYFEYSKINWDDMKIILLYLIYRSWVMTFTTTKYHYTWWDHFINCRTLLYSISNYLSVTNCKSVIKSNISNMIYKVLKTYDELSCWRKRSRSQSPLKMFLDKTLRK